MTWNLEFGIRLIVKYLVNSAKKICFAGYVIGPGQIRSGVNLAGKCLIGDCEKCCIVHPDI